MTISSEKKSTFTTREFQSTIFIIITRGFIVRNILRSGTLESLIKAGQKVVLIFPEVQDVALPEYFYSEFNNPQIVIEVLPKRKEGRLFMDRLYNLFIRVAPYLVFTRSTEAYGRIGNAARLERNTFWLSLEKIVYTPLSKLQFLKTWARWLELHVFFKPVYADYFEKHSPSLVFSTSIVASYDMQFMKEAKRRGIATVSMPKGWDNITKTLYRVVPDVLIVQNETMKTEAAQIQKINPDTIAVCGFPQFDWYVRPEIILSREEFFKRIGLSSDRRLIFFGSEGAWAPGDHHIADRLSQLITKPDVFVKDCSLLVRPHFSDVKKKRFDFLNGRPNVKVDTNLTFSTFFMDNWDPSVEETKLFVNCLYHADVVIIVASTLALDATAMGKASVAIDYGVLHDPKDGKDISTELYKTDHFQSVLSTGALDLVKDDHELIASINTILKNPDYKQQQRQELIEKLCYKVDGQSSQRLAQVLLKAISDRKK